MTDLLTLTFDGLACSLLTVCVIREVMLRTLPDRVAGPGGWLIDTAED